MKRSFKSVDGIYIKVRDASVKLVVDDTLASGEVRVQTQGWGGGNTHASKGKLGGDDLYIFYESNKRPLEKVDYRWGSWQIAGSTRLVISESGPTITVHLPRGMRYRTFRF